MLMNKIEIKGKTYPILRDQEICPECYNGREALKNLLILQPNYIIMMQPWNALFMQHWMK